MTKSTLRQILTIFEETKIPLSINLIARSLDVSTERVQGMLEYWVRKGRIREVANASDCGTCSSEGSCAFVVDLPRSYELASDTILLPLHSIGSACDHREEINQSG